MIYTNFELGLINAYLLLIVYHIMAILPFIYKKKNRPEELHAKKIKRDSSFKFLYHLSSVLFILAIFVSFFLPIVFNSIFFYIGFSLWATGIVIVSNVCISWIKAPIDKPVTTGMYKYSRNPMYLSFFFSYIGIGLVSSSWIFLIITSVYMVITVLFVNYEEKFCLEKYGDKYKSYMKKTPRWIGFKK